MFELDTEEKKKKSNIDNLEFWDFGDDFVFLFSLVCNSRAVILTIYQTCAQSNV